MLHLYELLGEHKDRLLEHWTAEVRHDDGAPLPDEAGRESLFFFLNELAGALRRASDGGTPLPPHSGLGVDEAEDAGSNVDPIAATRAYGLLHSFILQIAADQGIDVGLAEQTALALHVNAAIARLVEGSIRRQRREQRRVAHELRNPLGSAMMALTLLRARADLGDHVRLAEMIERNLQRVERGLGEGLPR
jgi:signal transduction histidine kinase